MSEDRESARRMLTDYERTHAHDALAWFTVGRDDLVDRIAAALAEARREGLREYEELRGAVRDFLVSPGVSAYQARVTRLAWPDQATTYGPPLRASARAGATETRTTKGESNG